MVAIVSGSGVGLINTSAGTLGQDGIFGNAASGTTNEAAYVNVATGNLSLQREDDFVASKGIDLSLVRTYNSRGALSGVQNWQLGIRKQITGLTGTVNTAGSSVTRIDGDGSASLYQYDAARGAYVSTDGGGAYQTITYSSTANEWTWRADHNDLKGVYERYDFAAGLIRFTGDAFGVRLTYTYDAATNRVTNIKDATGDFMYFDYTGANVSKVRVKKSGFSSDQSRVSYGYDSQGRMTSVVVDLTPDTKNDAKTYVTTYTYVGTTNLVETVTQADGTSLRLTYEPAGGQDRVTSITDGLGRTTTFDYTVAGKTTVADHLGARTTYAYDAKGQLLSITAPSVGGVAQITQFRYDAAGNVTQTIDARGLVTEFGYDANGNQVLERDAAGNTIKRTFSSSNLLLSELRFIDIDPDGAGDAQPVVRLTTRYAYDANNLLRFVIDPEGGVQELRYDTAGQLTARLAYLDARQPDGAAESTYTFSALSTWAASAAVASSMTTRSEYSYDTRGLVSQERQYDTPFAANVGTLPIAAITRGITYMYNLVGQVSTMYDSRNNATYINYDGLGRKLYTSDWAGNLTFFSYDDLGHKSVTTAPNGVVTTSTYDKAGQLTAVTVADAAGVGVGQTSYAYDAAGRLRMQTDPNGARSFMLYDEAGRKTADVSASGSLTEYRYDANGQLAHTIAYATRVSTAALVGTDGKPLPLTLEQSGLRPAATDADRREWRLYDNANRLSKTVDALGVVTDYSYDGASRLVEVARRATKVNLASFAANPVAANASPAAAGDSITRNAYDKNGHLRYTIDGEGYLIELRYNGVGQPTGTTRYALRATAQLQAGTNWSQQPIATSTADITTSSGYDAMGRLVSETDGAGNVTTHTYDAEGNLLSSTRAGMTVRYDYDRMYRLAGQYVGLLDSASGQTPSVTRFTYNSVGNRITATDPAGGVDQFVYDANNRLIFSVDALGIVSELRYDANGNTLASVRYATPIASTPAGAALTEAEVRARLSGTAAYDTTEVRRYDSDGRLAWSVDGAGAVTEFRYDAVGNLVGRIAYATVLTDARMAELAASPAAMPAPAGSATSATSYLYDGNGRLVFTVDSQGGVSEARYDNAGNVVETVLYAKPVTVAAGASLAAVRAALQTGASDTHAFQRYDQLGRMAWSVDGAGVATQLSYDTRGNLVSRVVYSTPLTAAALAALAADPAALPAPAGAFTVVSHVYDGADRLVFTVDALATVVETRYDANGNVLESVQYGKPVAQLLNRSANAAANNLSVGSVRAMLGAVGAADGRSIQRYDNQGRLTWSIDPLGAAVRLSYDLNGNVIARVAYTEALGAAALATLAADPQAQPAIASDAPARATRYAYDRENRLVFTVDTLGGVTETRYDANGQVSDTIRYANAISQASGTATGTGAVLTIAAVTAALQADAARDVHAFQRHDKDGRLTWTVDGNGVATRIGYDANGNVYSRAVYATPLDAAALAALASDARLAPAVGADAAYSATFYVHDSDNRLVFTIDPAGAVTEARYDGKDQLIDTVLYSRAAATLPALAGAELTPATVRSNLLRPDSTSDMHQIRRYDNAGRLSWNVDAAGTATQISYDARGNAITRVVYGQPLTASALAALAGSLDALPAPAGATTVTRQVFDASDRLVFSVDALGEVTENRYDVNDQVVETVRYANRIDPAQGDSVEHVRSALRLNTAVDVRSFQRYDLDGRLTWTVDPVGAAVQLRYDGAGNLVERIAYSETLGAAALAALSLDPAALPQGGGSATRSRYVYDEYNRQVFDVDPLGLVSETRYDAMGNVVETIRYAKAIDLAAVVATATLADIRARLTVDAAKDTHQLERHDAGGRLTWSVNASGAATEFAYDAAGNVVRRSDYTTVLSAAVFANLAANPQTMPQPAGTANVTRYVYDGDSRLVYTVDALGSVTENRYDTADHVIEQVRYAKAIDPTGTSVSASVRPDAADQVSRFVYDQAGRLTFTIDGTGAVSERVYDAAGNVIRTVEHAKPLAGVQVWYAPGTNSSISRVVGPFKAGDTVTATVWYKSDAGTTGMIFLGDTGGATPYNNSIYSIENGDGGWRKLTATRTLTEDEVLSIYCYGDRDGTAADKTGHNALYTNFQVSSTLQGTVVPNALENGLSGWDVTGNANVATLASLAATSPTTTGSLATMLAASASSLDQTTRYAYDAIGRVVFATDALGAVTENRYDATGKVIETIGYANKIDPAQAGVGDIATVRLRLQPGASDRHQQYRYDLNGRLTWSIDPLGAATQQVYDAAGNLARIVRYAGGLKGTLADNASPQVVAAVPSSGAYLISSALDRISTFTYDADGRVLTQNDGVGTAEATSQSWAYDHAGNAIRHTDGRGNTSWSAYDAQNRLVRHVDALGQVTGRTYFADGRLKSETRYTNPVAMPAAANDAWAYDNASSPVANTDALKGDQITSWTYDAAGRVYTETDAQSGVVRHLYDALGNRTDTTVAFGNPAAVTRHFTYDARSRVLTDTRAFNTAEASTTTYGYDSFGNQTLITTGGRTTYQYFDVAGRKFKVKDADGATTSTTYNAFGDIVKVVDARQNAGYFYTDALGRVTLQIDPEGAVSETRYDLQGNTTFTIRYANKVQGAYNEQTAPAVLAQAGSGAYVVQSGNDQVQETVFDALGRKTTVRTAYEGTLNYTESFKYDRNGNLETLTSRNGAVTTYEYDKNNRLFRETLPASGKTAAGDVVPIRNERQYDARGNVVKTIEALGLPEQRTTVFEFDKRNRQVKETGDAITTFDPATRTDQAVTPTKERKYDLRGNLIEEVDVRGGRTLHYYDRSDREVGRIDPSGTYTRSTYDVAGMKSEQVVYANAVATVGGAIPNGSAPVPLAAGAALPASGAYVRLDPANDRTTSYTYDGAGRLKTTLIKEISTATFNPTLKQFNVTPGDILTQSFYDGAGNLIKSIDANGNVTRNYYDKAGQLTAQLDAMRYLTVYTRDGFGNIETQTSYANAVTSAVDDNTTQAQLVVAGDAAADRITRFTYDRMGRTLTEARQNVVYATVDGGSGAVANTTGTATTVYAYDGLSNVVKRTDANGAVTDWEFDKLGRKTRELQASFVDYRGVSVRTTTDFEYDGLDNVTRQLVRGENNSVETDDRITRYQYGAGGYLIGQTDPEQGQLDYRIDAAGNITRKTLVGRVNADKVKVNDVTFYWYDAGGREIRHTDEATGTVAETRYNSFGEISGKRTNPATGSTEWAEFADYDQAGRTWRSNVGDGITKVYVYDKNGNTTLKLDNPSVNLADTAARKWTLNDIKSLSGINQFFSTYDARNQLTGTYQPEMLGGHNIITVVESLTQKGGSSFAGASGSPVMWVAGGLTNAATPVAPTTPGAVTIERWQTSTVSLTDVYSGMPPKYYTYDSPTLTGAKHTLNMTVPDTSAWGTGPVRVEVDLEASGELWGYHGWFNPTPGVGTASFTFNEEIDPDSLGDPAASRSFTYTIYKETDVGPIKLATHTWRRPAPARGTTTVSSEIATGMNLVQFSGQRPDTQRLVLMTRPAGGNGGWSIYNVPQAYADGYPQAGRFVFDWSALAGGNYDFRYVGFNAANEVVNSQQGVMTLGSSLTISQNSHTMGGTGRAFVDASGAFVFNELGGAATSLVIKYRPVGSGAAWTERTIGPDWIGGTSLPGWFTFRPDGLWGNYEFEIDPRNTGGVSTMNKSSSTFTVGSPSSINEPSGVSVQTTPSATIGVSTISQVVQTATFVRTTRVTNGNPKIAPHADNPVNTLTVPMPDTSFWGSGNVRIALSIEGSEGGYAYDPLSGEDVYCAYYPFDQSFYIPYGQSSAVLNATQWAEGAGGNTGAYYSYTLYKQTPYGEVQIASYRGYTAGAVAGSTYNSKVSTTYSPVQLSGNLMVFDAQPTGPAPARMLLEYRVVDTNTGWSTIELPRQTINGGTMGNRFVFDWTWYQRANYEYRAMSLDGAGNVIAIANGRMNLNVPSSVTPAAPSLLGGAGRVFMDNWGYLIFNDQGTDTATLSIRYRAPGTEDPWSERTVLYPFPAGGTSTRGYFLYAPPNLPGGFEYVVEARNANNQVIRKTASTFTPGNADTAKPLVGYTEPPVVTYFPSQPVSGVTMRLSYRPSGNGAYTQVTLGKGSNGMFQWASSNVFSSETQPLNYDYSYEVLDTNGVLVNKAHGVVTLGSVSRVLSHTPDVIPTLASFTLPSNNPVAATATYMDLQFRLAGSGAAFSSATLWNRNGNYFLWDAGGVVAPGAKGTVEYSYTLRSGSTVLRSDDGNPIEVKGTLYFGPTDGAAQLQTLVGERVNNVKLISHTQATNAFGEVVSETNARGFTTTISYNTLGSMTAKQDPTIDVTMANGYKYAMSPRTTYYVDRTGRTIATRDANENLVSQLLFGTGGGMKTEFHADGGKKLSYYDVFGDVRYSVDELNQRTDYTYDKNGRLTIILRPLRTDGARSEVQMTYDQAGNRITQAERAKGTDSFAAYTSKTWYDSMGRVAKVMTPDGRSSTYQYVWDNAIKSTGGRVTGGWRQTITDPMGRTSIDEIDAYGRTTAHTDLGGHTFVYSFNYAGWLTGQTGSSGQNIMYTYYANGYVESIRDIALDTESHYEYDEAGNRKYESYSRKVNGVTEYLENAAIDYDAANRVTRIHDTRADITYEYDAVGNRRRVRSVYHDGVQGSMQVQDFWYDYDNMNRFTVTMGRLSGAAATAAWDTSVKVVLGAAGSEGVRLQYNKAGQRIQAVYARDNHREDYKYGVEGYLEDTYINANDSAQGTLASKRVNDLLGRTTNYYEYNGQGGMIYERSTVYSADGRQLSQSGTDGQIAYQYYSQLVNGADSVTRVSASGAGELAIVTTTAKDGTVVTNYTAYEYWDEAKQRSLTVKGETAYKPDTAWRPGVSSLTYDFNGHLKSATDAGADGKMGTADLDKDNVTFSYISNAQGLVLRREQYTGNKVGMMHRYLYLNGAMVGDVGNDGDARLDYAQSLGQAKASREEMYKNWTPISSADFDQNYQPINRTYPAATGSTYVVKAGDSLYAIAGAVWGDVSMWYLIAEANGITAETPLTPNQTLTIPNKVTNIHNNSGTSRPYDAGAIIGDLSPTLPDAPLPAPPPQKSGGGCGGLGMVIMAVIAVVVTVYAGPQIGAAIYSGVTGTATTAATLASVAAGGAAAGMTTLGAAAGLAAGMAAGAALGSVASQLAGIAMGMQDKINWRSVGTSALMGGLTSGAASALSTFGGATYAGLNVSARAAIQNVVGQGIGKLTGTQDHFSWKSVAVSAFSAPVMSAVRTGINGSQWAQDNGDYVRLAQNTASSLISATVNMVVDKGRVSWSSVAANAISGTIAEMYQDDLDAKSVTISDSSSGTTAGKRMPNSKQLSRTMSGGLTYDRVSGGEKDWLRKLGPYDGAIVYSNDDVLGSNTRQSDEIYQPVSKESGSFDPSSWINDESIRLNASATSYTSVDYAPGKVYVTHHVGLFDGLDMALGKASDWVTDQAASVARSGEQAAREGNTALAAYQKFWYVPTKTAAYIISGGINTARLATSPVAAPNLFAAMRSPVQTVQNSWSEFKSLSAQDKVAAGLSVLLPNLGSVTRVAGKIPGAGRFLQAEVGYSRGHGVTLATSDGKIYGSLPTVSITAGLSPLQAKQVGAVSFGRFGQIGDVSPLGANSAAAPAPARAGTTLTDNAIFTNRTQWSATRPRGTGQTYDVIQRNDIDWTRVRTDGPADFIGKTNAEAAAKGFSPQLADDSFSTLHHIGQDARGPLAEASTGYHGVGKSGQDALHSLYGRNMPHPDFPIDRRAFNVDTREYWKWRLNNQ